MGLEVSVEVPSLGKSLTTDVTGKAVPGIVRLMDQLVGPQDSLSFEPFLTSFALECFLQLVDKTDVAREIIFREILGAHLTLSDRTKLE